MIAGAWYEVNLGDYAKMCPGAKDIKDAAQALMPYDPANTAAQKDIDKL